MRTAPARLSNHGNNGLAPHRVAEIQRARLVAAMAEVCAERGARNVTVTHVVERAGVSRRTFYEVFADGEACLLDAFEEALALAWQNIRDGYVEDVAWVERMRASLAALLRFIDREPSFGRLLIVESLGAGPELLERRQRVLAALVAAVDEGRGETKRACSATSLTAEGLVGAVLAVLHGRLSQPEHEPLTGLVNPLLSMIVLPYLGSGAARRELERSVSEPAAPGPLALPNPLKGLKMRVTYRTVRVLATIESHPGSSNRAIGDAAGLSDQGQVSKLLARLEGLGLIENDRHGASRGEPNAWTLTTRGAEVNGALAGNAPSA